MMGIPDFKAEMQEFFKLLRQIVKLLEQIRDDLAKQAGESDV